MVARAKRVIETREGARPTLAGRDAGPSRLHIVDGHAEIVRDLFRRYLESGSVVRLQAVLDAENVRLPVRIDGTGKTTGGGLIGRGHLYKILSNPINVGRLSHKKQVHEGQRAAIIDPPT